MLPLALGTDSWIYSLISKYLERLRLYVNYISLRVYIESFAVFRNLKTLKLILLSLNTAPNKLKFFISYPNSAYIMMSAKIRRVWT